MSGYPLWRDKIERKHMLPRLYIIIPCYNEEEVLPITSQLFKDKLKELIQSGLIAEDSRVLFVNDGSKDRTWDIIKELSHKDSGFCGISLSRNRGHQNALLAGLMEAMEECDITISIDCDGQDDINAMDDMVKAYHKGAEIVYGIRSKRDTDTFFKRTTAEGFYRFMKWMGVETVFNHADYRLVSSKVLKEFSRYEEVNIFLRGMFPLVGFNSTSVFYERRERMAGKSHYPLRKMVALALDGITSLSIKPIRMISLLGVMIALLSFAGIIWVFVDYFFGHTVRGWASTTCLVCFVAGIQLISIGIIGEYIGKIYMEVKRRPRYIVGERTEEKSKDLTCE